MNLEQFKNEKWYVVYYICKNGDKGLYGTNLGTNYIFRKNQIKNIKTNCKKHGFDYEVHEVKVQILDKIDV